MPLQTQAQQKAFYPRYEHQEILPHEKVNEIVAALRKAQYKFTVAGKIRTDIKNMDKEDKEEILTLLHRMTLQAGNEDIAKYLKEIVD